MTAIGVPAGQASVKLAVVTVNGRIGSLKLTVTSELVATPVSPASGLVALTVGAVTSAADPVVKLQSTALAKALWAESLTPVLIRATQVVPAGRSPDGVTVAVLPLTAKPTAPVTAVPAGHANVKFSAVIVTASIGSLKLAVIEVLMRTPVTPASGLVELTVGAVVSATPPVVKIQLKSSVMALLATSSTAAEIVAVQVALPGRLLCGVKVATLPFAA
jgi:hypothetical protein